MEKMAANTQRGQMRPNHGSRTPPFVIVGLLVVIAILAFNYWSVSSTNRELNDQLSSLGIKYRHNDDVLKKREVSLNGELSSLKKETDEIRVKAKGQEETLRSKDVEISNLKSTIETKETEIEGLKTELQSEKAKSDDTWKKTEGCSANLTHCSQQLEEGKKECAQKGEELQSCHQREQSLQQEISTLKSQPQSCSTEKNNTRVALLTRLQQLGGFQVMELLTNAGVDTSGVVINKPGPGGQQQEQKAIEQNNQVQPGNQGQHAVVNQSPTVNQNIPAGSNSTVLSSANKTSSLAENLVKVQGQPTSNQPPVIQGENQPAVQGQPPNVNQNQQENSKQNPSNNQAAMQQGPPPQLQNNPNSPISNTSGNAQPQNNADMQINKPGSPQIQGNAQNNADLQINKPDSPQNQGDGLIPSKQDQPAANQPAQQVGPPKIHEELRNETTVNSTNETAVKNEVEVKSEEIKNITNIKTGNETNGEVKSGETMKDTNNTVYAVDKQHRKNNQSEDQIGESKTNKTTETGNTKTTTFSDVNVPAKNTGYVTAQSTGNVSAQGTGNIVATGPVIGNGTAIHSTGNVFRNSTTLSQGTKPKIENASHSTPNANSKSTGDASGPKKQLPSQYLKQITGNQGVANTLNVVKVNKSASQQNTNKGSELKTNREAEKAKLHNNMDKKGQSMSKQAAGEEISLAKEINKQEDSQKYMVAGEPKFRKPASRQDKEPMIQQSILQGDINRKLGGSKSLRKEHRGEEDTDKVDDREDTQDNVIKMEEAENNNEDKYIPQMQIAKEVPKIEEAEIHVEKAAISDENAERDIENDKTVDDETVKDDDENDADNDTKLNFATSTRGQINGNNMNYINQLPTDEDDAEDQSETENENTNDGETDMHNDESDNGQTGNDKAYDENTDNDETEDRETNDQHGERDDEFVNEHQAVDIDYNDNKADLTIEGDDQNPGEIGNGGKYPDEDMEEDQALKFRGKADQEIQEEENDLDRGFN